MQDFRDKILGMLSPNFNTEQLQMVDKAILEAEKEYTISKKETLPAKTTDGMIVDIHDYLVRKKVKGLAKGTLQQYRQGLMAFNVVTQKPLAEVQDVDVIVFLEQYEHYRKIGPNRKDSLRRILKTFFTYMANIGRILKNPTMAIDAIKTPKYVRKPLTGMELRRIRKACKTPRDEAMVEFLLATGCRVSEVVELNKDDIDIENKRIRVIGKGNKERWVFLNITALGALYDYFASRTDYNPALFVSEKRPHNRIGKNAIEKAIKKLGEIAKLRRNLYPHLFRHTMATMLYNKGMRIEDLQIILGHVCADTTRIYAQYDPILVQQAYNRYAAA